MAKNNSWSVAIAITLGSLVIFSVGMAMGIYFAYEHYEGDTSGEIARLKFDVSFLDKEVTIERNFHHIYKTAYEDCETSHHPHELKVYEHRDPKYYLFHSPFFVPDTTDYWYSDEFQRFIKRERNPTVESLKK